MDRPNPSTDKDPDAPAPLRDPRDREKPQAPASGETSVVRRERDDGTLPGSPSQQQRLCGTRPEERRLAEFFGVYSEKEGLAEFCGLYPEEKGLAELWH